MLVEAVAAVLKRDDPKLGVVAAAKGLAVEAVGRLKLDPKVEGTVLVAGVENNEGVDAAAAKIHQRKIGNGEHNVSQKKNQF